jgi:hypothetical protein
VNDHYRRLFETKFGFPFEGPDDVILDARAEHVGTGESVAQEDEWILDEMLIHMGVRA